MIWEENMRRGQAGGSDLDAYVEAEARQLLAAAFETVPARPGLAADLMAAAGQHGPADAAIGLVRKRAAWARRRRVLVPAGAVALAAAVAVAGGVTAGVITDDGGASPTALQAVTAALVKMSAQSFTFEEGDNVSGSNGSLHLGGRNGEFNPANGNGEQEIYRPGGQVIQYRFIGKYTYVRSGDLQDGKPWVRWSNGGGTASPVGIAQAEGGTVAPINPVDLLTALKGVSTVRYGGPASGTGWTGTSYSFTVNPTKEFPAPKVSGTVSVDSSGRVRKLVTTTPIGPNRGHMTTFTETITFGGFGMTVSVTPPPPSEVYIGG